MKHHIKKIINRIAPSISEERQRLHLMDEKLDAILEKTKSFEDIDHRLTRLKRLLGRVEHYQPTYHISGLIDTPQRTSLDRCRAIESSIGPLPGKRILDVGSSLGYVSFYMADRGAAVQGWEENVENAEAARLIKDINGIEADFRTKELNDITVDTIQKDKLDVVIILSVVHHIIRFNGLEYTQKLMESLLDRIPVMVVELARKGEDSSLPWDASQPDDELEIFKLVKDRIDIEKIGDFGNHLSKRTRPLYVIKRKNIVKINNREYGYDTVSNVAYKGSPVAFHQVRRRYFFSDSYVIKEYALREGLGKDAVGQILNEIQLLTNLSDKGVYHLPKILDFEVNSETARIVIERVQGQLLSDTGESSSEKLKQYLHDIARTLSDLHALRINHNDVRSWNIIVNDKGAWLIDYGLASPVAIEDDVVATFEALASSQKGSSSPYSERDKDLRAVSSYLPKDWSGLMKRLPKEACTPGDVIKALS